MNNEMVKPTKKMEGLCFNTNQTKPLGISLSIQE